MTCNIFTTSPSKKDVFLISIQNVIIMDVDKRDTFDMYILYLSISIIIYIYFIYFFLNLYLFLIDRKSVV